MSGEQTVADVLLLLPLARTYTYLVPEALEDRLQRGRQVRCPVRGRQVPGLVIRVRPRSDQDVMSLQPIGDVVTSRPPWPGDLLDLVEWTANYYLVPVGVVARTAMPGLFSRHPPKKDPLVVFVRRPEVPPRSLRDRALLALLEAAGEMDLNEARQAVPQGAVSVKRLLAAGCLRMTEREEVPEVPGPVPPPPQASRVTPTEHQTEAIDRILEAVRKPRYQGFLLHGVTGSGKTEVYLRAIEECLALGRGAVVLVPEIALTVELQRQFHDRFGDLAEVLHSAMSQGRRVRAWDRVLAGQVRVVVGARSAVFAPMPRLGLVIVDEEHEVTYKQQDGLRYHARDLALVRGSLAGCPVVLGSATPSLESFQNAHIGKLTFLSMPRRVMERPLPQVTLVDLRYERPQGGERLFSEPLRVALQATLDRGESAILFLNRRGFGRFLVCRSCGRSLQCPNCSITLTHHRRPERLQCHYCDHHMPVPDRCPGCNSPEVEVVGFGTERLEEEVQRLFPKARCGRLDSEVSQVGALGRVLADFREGRLNVLVGTQIVVKGHDFPQVTLVGVLLAEQSLAFPDFRASERTFQLLTQVAGRAGRGDRPGQVLIQTFDPTHEALRHAANHDYLGFAVTENRIRRERGYPPHAHLAAIEVSGPDGVEVQRTADEIREVLDQCVMAAGPEGRQVTVLGPAAAAIERLRGRTRSQVLVKAGRRKVLHDLLRQVQNVFGDGRGALRVTLDVDPYYLL
ncbi:MAG TPA: primosomal protein N' [Myxococcota bacterium]|nr:primosomal protein N' [Myxococcota bacterium]HQK51951.1 primosomal protein N' [Myxococcota bacterium]